MQQTWFGRFFITFKVSLKAIKNTTKSLNKIRTPNPHSLIVFKISNLFKTLVLRSCSKLPISLFIVPFELCCFYSSFPQPSYASEEEEKFVAAIVDDEERSPQVEMSD